jgi:hypothetical protein
MSRSTWIHAAPAVIIALGALFFIRPHNANAAILSEESAVAGAPPGRGVVQGMSRRRGKANAASDRRAGFRRHSQPTVDHGAFVKSVPSDQPPEHTKHRHRPPDQADDLVNYILSLKRN